MISLPDQQRAIVQWRRRILQRKLPDDGISNTLKFNASAQVMTLKTGWYRDSRLTLLAPVTTPTRVYDIVSSEEVLGSIFNVQLRFGMRLYVCRWSSVLQLRLGDKTVVVQALRHFSQ